jgi:hypothetical protein
VIPHLPIHPSEQAMLLSGHLDLAPLSCLLVSHLSKKTTASLSNEVLLEMATCHRCFRSFVSSQAVAPTLAGYRPCKPMHRLWLVFDLRLWPMPATRNAPRKGPPLYWKWHPEEVLLSVNLDFLHLSYAVLGCLHCFSIHQTKHEAIPNEDVM